MNIEEVTKKLNYEINKCNKIVFDNWNDIMSEPEIKKLAYHKNLVNMFNNKLMRMKLEEKEN